MAKTPVSVAEENKKDPTCRTLLFPASMSWNPESPDYLALLAVAVAALAADHIGFGIQDMLEVDCNGEIPGVGVEAALQVVLSLREDQGTVCRVQRQAVQTCSIPATANVMDDADPVELKLAGPRKVEVQAGL
eukprot:CAMPEP_0181474206 /NCGR_PEP_ID=MMETSP1110-20121109/40527_1 /TAXON_ID=174948 /ORGANISM="Symbiodinium sp., Strain CCMP421" /LENGTH=132 /DNA_ID=CAMNT_0023599361 /DNA_START=139 /DNA_END=534 /DNA_ORIENTATION=-